MNTYVRKYSHPHRVTPRSSVTKRYVYRDGKLVEISLTNDELKPMHTRKGKR